MAINVIVQYNGGFLSDILLLTQAHIFVYGSMALLSYIITTLLTMYYIVFCFVMLGGSVTAYETVYILLLPCWMLYYIVTVLFLLLLWCLHGN